MGLNKSDDYYDEKYGNLRANVPLRRKLYVWIIAFALLTLAWSIIDITLVDSAMFWGVMAAYVVLLVWAFFMLFSGGEDDYEPVHTRGPVEAERDYLRCTTCLHVFAFDMEHMNARKGVRFSCPECGAIGKVPPMNRERTEAPVPGGAAEGPRFVCHNCDERWSVGALGHHPKADVRFSACPYCGHKDDVHILMDDDPETPY